MRTILHGVLEYAVQALIIAALVGIKWKSLQWQRRNDKLGDGGIQTLFGHP
jgi:hypothetical protein